MMPGTKMTHRKRFQFSLLTALGMMIAFATLLGLNMWPRPARWNSYQCFSYGWPTDIITLVATQRPLPVNRAIIEQVEFQGVFLNALAAVLISVIVFIFLQGLSGISD